MAAVTALRRQPPPLSSLRVELADRITRRNAADQEEAALEAALMWDGAATQGIRAAERELEAATEAVERAKADAAQGVVNTALGHASSPTLTIKAARAAQVDAQDALDAATAAKAAVQDRLKALRGQRTFKPDFGVRDTAIAVLQAEATDLIAKLKTQCELAQQTMVKAGLALSWLDGVGVVERGVVPGIHGGQSILDRKLADVLMRFRSVPDTWQEWLQDPALRADIAWAEALDRLIHDPDAPLPPAV